MAVLDIKLQRHDLFPTRIWSFELAYLQPQLAAWESRILQWRAEHPEMAGRSNRRGWNSDKTVLAMPAFAPLATAAQQCFRQALREMSLAEHAGFALEGWVNLHQQGSYNVAHLHPGVLLCGVFYISTPQDGGVIVFRDPRPGAVLSSFAKQGVNQAQQHAVRPFAGQLLVFPNWLEHYVEASEAVQPRIAIGINALLEMK